LLSRVWPERFPELRRAFENFRIVLQDLMNTFDQHSEETGSTVWTKKFYHLDRYDPQRYHELHRQFIFHGLLVQDLMLELTRAVNFIGDQVRASIASGYRREEGVALAESGPYMDMTYRTHRAEYRPEERADLYPGLGVLMSVRTERDQHRGIGESDDAPAFLEEFRMRGSN